MITISNEEKRELVKRIKGDSEVSEKVKEILKLGLDNKERVIMEGMRFPLFYNPDYNLEPAFKEFIDNDGKLTIILSTEDQTDKDNEFFSALKALNEENVEILYCHSNQIILTNTPSSCPPYWGDFSSCSTRSIYISRHNPKPEEHNHEGVYTDIEFCTKRIYKSAQNMRDEIRKGAPFISEIMEEIFNNTFYEDNISWLKSTHPNKWAVILHGDFYNAYDEFEDAVTDVRKDEKTRCPHKVIWYTGEERSYGRNSVQ